MSSPGPARNTTPSCRRASASGSFPRRAPRTGKRPRGASGGEGAPQSEALRHGRPQRHARGDRARLPRRQASEVPRPRHAEHRREGEAAGQGIHRRGLQEGLQRRPDGRRGGGEAGGVRREVGRDVSGLKSLLTMPNLFTYLSFPKPMRKSIYTSNVIESFNGKAKRELAKRVSMNSLGNALFCMTQIAREYNRHARKIPGYDEMTGTELEEAEMRR